MRLLRYLYDHYFSSQAVPYWIILLLDTFGVVCGVALAAYLEQGVIWVIIHRWQVLWGMLLTVAVFCLGFRIFHTYSGVVRYSSFAELKDVAAANAVSSVTVFLISLLFMFLDVKSIRLPGFYGVLVLFGVSTMLMWLFRIGVKVIYDSLRINDWARKVFIYGVGAGAVALSRSIDNEDPVRYSLAGFVNPGQKLASKYLRGVKIRTDGPHLISKMKEAGAEILLISPHETENFRERQGLINELIDSGIKIMMMPNPEVWDGRSEMFKVHLREVEVEDLLPRQKIEINMDGIAAQLKGRVVLITGAAGSIGSEMVRQVALFHPAQMILIDQAETPMHDIRMMMYSEFGEGCPDESVRVPVETVVASITDEDFMEKMFRTYKPEYVFHAAAYKHVPMMEDNPAIAVRNNICGTRVIADLAVKYGVDKFVMISTDKAVNPTNVMGCSKRICEIYCQSLNKAIQEGEVKGVTQFVTTRFGNVLGSNGSVIPIFKEQIAKGGPITVTDPNVIRYFMLIPEACKLVLEAGTMGHGGEIFAFDMGSPVRIADLANRMIALSGAKDIEIKYTGLRDGEKLYEEVLSDKENTKPTVHPKIMVASVREYDYRMACENEQRLLEATYHLSKKDIVRLMEEIVPEYHSTNENYQ